MPPTPSYLQDGGTTWTYVFLQRLMHHLREANPIPRHASHAVPSSLERLEDLSEPVLEAVERVLPQWVALLVGPEPYEEEKEEKDELRPTTSSKTSAEEREATQKVAPHVQAFIETADGKQKSSPFTAPVVSSSSLRIRTPPVWMRQQSGADPFLDTADAASSCRDGGGATTTSSISSTTTSSLLPFESGERSVVLNGGIQRVLRHCRLPHLDLVRRSSSRFGVSRGRPPPGHAFCGRPSSSSFSTSLASLVGCTTLTEEEVELVFQAFGVYELGPSLSPLLPLAMRRVAKRSPIWMWASCLWSIWWWSSSSSSTFHSHTFPQERWETADKTSPLTNELPTPQHLASGFSAAVGSYASSTSIKKELQEEEEEKKCGEINAGESEHHNVFRHTPVPEGVKKEREEEKEDLYRLVHRFADVCISRLQSVAHGTPTTTPTRTCRHRSPLTTSHRDKKSEKEEEEKEEVLSCEAFVEHFLSILLLTQNERRGMSAALKRRNARLPCPTPHPLSPSSTSVTETIDSSDDDDDEKEEENNGGDLLVRRWAGELAATAFFEACVKSFTSCFSKKMPEGEQTKHAPTWERSSSDAAAASFSVGASLTSSFPQPTRSWTPNPCLSWAMLAGVWYAFGKQLILELQTLDIPPSSSSSYDSFTPREEADPTPARRGRGRPRREAITRVEPSCRSRREEVREVVPGLASSCSLRVGYLMGMALESPMHPPPLAFSGVHSSITEPMETEKKRGRGGRCGALPSRGHRRSSSTTTTFRASAGRRGRKRRRRWGRSASTSEEESTSESEVEDEEEEESHEGEEDDVHGGSSPVGNGKRVGRPTTGSTRRRPYGTGSSPPWDLSALVHPHRVPFASAVLSLYAIPRVGEERVAGASYPTGIPSALSFTETPIRSGVLEYYTIGEEIAEG